MSQRSRAWLPWVLLVIGVAAGVIIALLSPWQLCLVERERPEAAALLDFVREQYIVSVSDSYAANGDLTRAQERLAALGEEDTASAVAELAARYVERGEEVETTRRLAALTQALGAGDEAMAEYLVATAPSPTPTETTVPTSTPTESPTSTATSTPIPTATSTALPPAPATATPTRAPAHPTPVPREWDRRFDLLLYRWVWMQEAQVSSGQWYWRLIRARYLDNIEARGLHHIFVEVLDENGQRIYGPTVVIEHGGEVERFPYPDYEKLGEEYALNYPMTGLLGGYNAYIDGLPSDKIFGMGLGTWMEPQMTHHTCFLLTFQRTYQR